jgi:hypothetical protein
MEKVIAAASALVIALGVLLIGTAVDDDDTPAASSAAAAVAAGPATDGEAITVGSQAGDDHAHSDAESVDDRGFSKLANGEQHGHEFTQAVSPEDRVELGRQLALAREVALQYPTVADAERAGLRRAGPFSPGLGAHYINYAGLGNADGKMSDDDIRKPLAWIYDGTKPDSRIAGLFYQTPLAAAEGFAGPNDTWHQHSNICITTGTNGMIDTPLGADRDATTEQCAAVGGNLIEQTQYLLHVWPVPGYESPEGVFSHLSSAVTCDDGTYNVIADVTKVGTKTTICLDGTE